MVAPVVSLGILHVPDVADRRAMHRQQIEAMGGRAAIRERVSRFHVQPAERDKSRLWHNSRATYAAYDPDATHHVVLQDDAIPVEGFLDALPMIIAARPDHPIGFFSRRSGPVGRARARGHWWWTSTGIPGVAVLLPVPMLCDWLEWMDREVMPDYPHDDRRLEAYLQTHGLRSWMTTPSLVQHVGGGKSLLGHANDQLAYWLLDGRADAVPWHDVPDTPVRDAGAGGVRKDWDKIFGGRR